LDIFALKSNATNYTISNMNYLSKIYKQLQYKHFPSPISMKNIVCIVTAVILTMLIMPGVVSCTKSKTKNLRNTSVQVWIDDYPEGTGIIVGDGTEVLVIMGYYMSPVPNNVYIIYDSDERYEAEIESVDFRTGATLLKIEGGPLPVATTGSASRVKQDDRVFVYGWSFTAKDYEETGEGKKPVFGKAEFKKKSEVVVSTGTTDTTSFNIRYPEGTLPDDWASIGQGDIVTDGDGIILGLVGNWFWGLVVPPGVPGSLPPVVNIDSLLELMSEDAEQKIWTKGPSGYNFARPNGLSAYGKAPSNYEAVASEILTLLSSLGDPVETDRLLDDFSRLPFAPKTGKLLVAVYASPIDFHTPGDSVISARWILLRWNVPEENNCVIYGMEPYEPEGAFEITGDINMLETLLSAEP
jgi:hypothetical protein